MQRTKWGIPSSNPYQSNKFGHPDDKIFKYRRAFAANIERPFGVRYNPYTLSVDILSNAQKIATFVSELRGDLCIVRNALKKIHEQDETVDIERITHMLQDGIQIENPDEEEK